MPKVFTSKKQKIGEVGENIATRFLMKHGFKIIERNYTKPCGEIDIVAIKSGKLFFVEVKSISTFVFGRNEKHGACDSYRPEENIHPLKMRRMARTVQTYLLQRHVSCETEWQVDLIVIFMNFKDRIARIKVVKDIIL